jgi:hypothetical protein
MGVADCAKAEAAASNAAAVMKLKSFAIFMSFSSAFNANAVKMVAIIPRIWHRGRRISPNQPGAFLFCALVDRDFVVTVSRGFVLPILD